MRNAERTLQILRTRTIRKGNSIAQELNSNTLLRNILKVPTETHTDSEATLRMLESQVVAQLVTNEASSPQPLGNSLYYRLRVTGTGKVSRSFSGDTERPADRYVGSPEFLDRCVGLPIVIEHPDGPEGILTGDSKIVGTSVHAYIPADCPNEVWCIGRIISTDAQDLLLTTTMSTSPSVVTCVSKVNPNSGEAQEGNPLVIDHLAIVPQGVWDHNGPPSGIDQDILLSESADTALDSEISTDPNGEVNNDIDIDNGSTDSNATVAKNPLATTTQVKETEMNQDEMMVMVKSAIEEALKPIYASMESYNTAKGPAVQDSEPGPSEGSIPLKVTGDPANGAYDGTAVASAKEAQDKQGVLADMVYADSIKKTEDTVAALQARIAQLESVTLNDADLAALATVRDNAQSISELFGDTASLPMPGEKPLPYRRRLLEVFKKHSPKWKDVSLQAFNDAKALDAIEDQIFNDARIAANTPAVTGVGSLRAVTHTDGAGRRITEYHGDSGAWMETFRQRPRVGILNTK